MGTVQEKSQVKDNTHKNLYPSYDQEMFQADNVVSLWVGNGEIVGGKLKHEVLNVLAKVRRKLKVVNLHHGHNSNYDALRMEMMMEWHVIMILTQEGMGTF